MSNSTFFERIGIAIVDMQTVHLGHSKLLNAIRMSCSRGIIGLGSVNQHSIHGHPFTFEQRKKMIKTLHGDFFEFVPLQDIDGNLNITEWYDYVKTKLKSANLPEPTDYFTGSEVDAKYYFHEFASLSDPSIQQGEITIYSGKDRYTDSQRDQIAMQYSISGTQHQKFVENLEMKKRLHIVDRHAKDIPSGREVRLMIELRDEKWKKHVPERLHEFIEQNYPPQIRIPISVKDLNADFQFDAEDYMTNPDVITNLIGDHDFVVGTRVLCESKNPFTDKQLEKFHELSYFVSKNNDIDSLIFELKDDGKWRPLKRADEKTEYARKQLENAALNRSNHNA